MNTAAMNETEIDQLEWCDPRRMDVEEARGMEWLREHMRGLTDAECARWLPGRRREVRK